MSDFSSSLPSRPSLEQLQKQAKELLRKLRAADADAQKRFASAGLHGEKLALSDAQFVLAREYGFETWARLKHHIELVLPSLKNSYQNLAEDVRKAYQGGDAGAVDRIGVLFGATLSPAQVRARVLLRLKTRPVGDTLSLAESQSFVAQLYGFKSWASFEASVAQPSKGIEGSVHGLSSTPPFYKINLKNNSLEPHPPVSEKAWDELLDLMQHEGITGLNAAGQMNDAVLARVAHCGAIKSLDLSGSRNLSDAGLKHLARMPQLESLRLNGCDINNAGLAVLGELPGLREFSLNHQSGISDEGLATLAFCHQLERVNLLGTRTGDGVIRALAGKTRLSHFLSGDLVTDAGLALLHDLPVFKRWQGSDPEYSLMTFQPEPNLLLLRGRLTDGGMKSLQGLDGLLGLNLDDSRLNLTSAALKPLETLPRLGWLGFDATDDTMEAIAGLPHLRSLMCQDTRAGDAGFELLSRSRTLEYLWGRRCYGLTGNGFVAMARLPSLRGLSVSCRNVDDAALSSLPEFPALNEFMPMDVPDEGFRHVGLCHRLETLWCMYCRDTGDAATAHLAGLKRLQHYYAGQTLITDRSLEVLAGMQTLERLTFEACAGVTNRGVCLLATLPRLKELSLELMAGVTREAIACIPARVAVTFAP